MTVAGVIFDVGGVLAHAAAGGFPEAFFGTHAENGDHPWHRLERGELTMAQAIPLLGLPTGRLRPPRPYTLDEAYVELAEQLSAAGIKLALCTNTTREGSALWQGLYPWADVFDVIVRSCDIGARKPDIRMVREALERLGTAPQETLFVDDLPVNRETARTLGVTTIDGSGRDGIALIRELAGVAAGAARRNVGYRGPRRPPVLGRADQLLINVMFAPERGTDPYPMLRELRETSPVHQLAGSPIWYASRYEHCRQALGHPDLVGDTGHTAVDFVTGEAISAPPSASAVLNPPRHAALDQVMEARLAGRRPDDAWRPWLRGIAAHVVRDAAPGSGPVDAVETLSYPIAMRVIGELLGVPADARVDIRSVVRDASAIFEPLVSPQRSFDAITAITELVEVLTGAKDTADGLLRDLLHAGRAARGVPDDDVIANVAFLFIAGFETLANLLSITLFLLSKHPEQYARLVLMPQLAGSAARESVRYHGPVQTDVRIAGRDVKLAGKTIPVGGAVVALLGAANRDPAAFPDPDRFDVTRSGLQPLTSGIGIHHHVGAHLAPLATAALLESLIEAGVRRIAAGPADWRPAVVLRGFDRLELGLG